MKKFASLVPLLAAIAAPAQDLAKLVDTIAPSVVTVRIVAEIELPAMMGGEKQEIRQEALGTVVDKSGLIMVPTSATDPGAQMSAMFGEDNEVTSNVTSLKVVIGNEAKELVATVVAKDDKLGVSFVKISDLGDRQLVPLAFDQKAEMAIGASVYAVRRLAEGYDFAPFAHRLEVSGRIKKPRAAWLLADAIDTGTPLFTTDGVLCGVVAKVEAGDKDASRESMMMRMFSGGGGSGPATFVVAPQVIANSITQAMEAAAKGLEAKPADAKDAPKEDAGK